MFFGNFAVAMALNVTSTRLCFRLHLNVYHIYVHTTSHPTTHSFHSPSMAQKNLLDCSEWNALPQLLLQL